MSEKKRLFILALVILLVIGLIFVFESMKAEPKQNIQQTSISTPELTGIAGYLNTNNQEIKISDYKGKVVLIDFWTYTCINCIRTLPYLTDWHKKYKDQGLVIIGVHTPEFNFEKDYDNVQNAIKKYNIEYAVVQDNDYQTWRAFKNRYWPRKYLIDKDGIIRYDHIGEGAYKETEEMIQTLLEELDQEINIETSEPTAQPQRRPLTPELYAGYKFALPRGQNLGNKQGLQIDTESLYELPEELQKDKIYLEGTWTSNPDDLVAVTEGSIVLEFLAREVNIVADSIAPTTISISINDQQQKIIEISEPQLYNLYQGEYARNKLTIKVKKDFSFNAFTFG